MWIVHFFNKPQVIWSVNHKFSGEKSYKKTTSKHKKYIIIDQIGTTCVNLFSFIFTTLFWKISFLNWLNCVFGMSHRTILYDRHFFAMKMIRTHITHLCWLNTSVLLASRFEEAKKTWLLFGFSSGTSMVINKSSMYRQSPMHLHVPYLR